VRIGLDVTAALRQGAGIGRFTREIIRAVFALDAAQSHQYVLFAATGGLSRAVWQPRLDYITQPLRASPTLCLLPLSDDWLHRLWHRARLPIPIELLIGRVDVFHAPDFVLPPTLPGTPTLLTVHDLTFRRDPDSAFPKLRRYLDRVVPRSVQRATHVLADSAATKNDLIELFGTSPQKVTVILGGVESRFAPVTDPDLLAAVRRKYALGAGPFILSIGTLQPRKNYARLIQAFADLRLPIADCRLPDHRSPITNHQSPITALQLVIVGGKGWLYTDIFAQVKRLGLENAALFPGFVDDADLPALYSAAAVFAYPSLYEGFGLPVLEAMACGAPVVTSNVSSLPEVAGDAALMVTPTDVTALGAALHRVLTDAALRQQMTARGLAQASKFTWENAARQLLAVYERVA
jgi:glycosyltransferase involved in cell wall biosynthesis